MIKGFILGIIAAIGLLAAGYYYIQYKSMRRMFDAQGSMKYKYFIEPKGFTRGQLPAGFAIDYAAQETSTPYQLVMRPMGIPPADLENAHGPVKLTITFEQAIEEYTMRTTNPDLVEISLDGDKKVMQVNIKKPLDPAGLNLFILAEQLFNQYPQIVSEPASMIQYLPAFQNSITTFTLTMKDENK